MKISSIDKDFVNIIEYLDNMGFKPFASCDGVEANHQNPRDVSQAYISFLKSAEIIDLMSMFLADKENFTISLGSESHFNEYELYGNIITGTTYQVAFENKSGQNTENFEDIIKMLVEKRKEAPIEDKKRLVMLDKVLEENADSDLAFRVTLNGKYIPSMNIDRKINELTITTKEEEGRVEGNICLKTERDMDVLADMLSKKYTIPIVEDSSKEEQEIPELMIYRLDRTSCVIYFTDEHFEEILEQIKYIKEIAHTLPTFESKEWIGTDEELYAEEYEETCNDEELEYKEDTPLYQRERRLAMLEQEAEELLKEEQLILDTRDKDE